MGAYYNEIEPYAVQWLRNLMKEGLIPNGEVDTRSILDVRPDDLRGFNQHHFFAGIGGWPCALRIAGWPDDRAVWTGSCPCQPFSLAGKQKGFADERHLWPIWRELIRERRPATIFGEQVASASAWLGLVRGDLEAVGYAVGAMPVEAASAGADHLRDRYWFVANATSEGPLSGPHGGIHREQEGARSWHVDAERCSASLNVADAASQRQPGQGALGEPLYPEKSPGRTADQLIDAGASSFAVADAGRTHGERWPRPEGLHKAETGQRDEGSGYDQPCSGDVGVYDWAIGADGKARRVKPGVRLLAHGVPARVAKLRALGNAIVPQVAAQFIIAASEGDLTWD